MSKVTRSEVQAVTPEAWASMLQPALRKQLVSTEITNSRFEPMLDKGDTFHYAYFSGDNTVISYTPFQTIDSHEKLETTDETLTVDEKPLLRKHVDDVEALYINVDAQFELADEAGYALKDYIDSKVFEEVENANAALSDGSVIELDQNNVISTFTSARKQLRQANVEEDGDWVAVVTPAVAEQIEIKATSSGFNVADAAFRNGYAGNFVGFSIYISNNLPEKTVNDTTCDTIYVGRRGMVHMIMKERPNVKVKDIPDSLGAYIYFYSVFGVKTFDKYSRRFLKGYVKSDDES